MKTLELTVVEKVLNNEGSPEQAREVVRWLATSEGQEWLSARMDSDRLTMGEGEEESYIDHPIPLDGLYQSLLKKIRRRKMRRLLFQAAAILIPFIILAGLFFRLDSQVDLFHAAEYDEIIAARGEQLQVVFQDGSRAFINSGSRIRYPRKFGLAKREVKMEGEAWFDVAENAKRPFIVDLKDIRVYVRGTKFNVKAYPDDNDISVSLETGVVELDGHAFRTFSILPGDKVVYNKATGKYAITHPEEITMSSAWKNNVLVFANAPLSEVITTLQRAFDVTFVVEDKAALKYTYVLYTAHTDLSLILRELEKITPVRFEQNGKMVRVYMK